MKLILNLKSIFTACLLFSSISSQVVAEDYNPDLLIFAGELRLYVQNAKKLSEISEASQERDLVVQELKQIGKRLGIVYFSETPEVIQTELDKHLSMTLKENASLKNHFIFMGNAFFEQAEKLVQRYKGKQKKVRTYSIAGGALVGVLIGGGYLFFKAKNTAGLATSALSGKDYAIAAGAVLGGTAIGFGVGTSYASKLPMDTSVKNAADFAAKYPHGEDFINKLEGSRDLALLRSELN